MTAIRTNLSRGRTLWIFAAILVLAIGGGYVYYAKVYSAKQTARTTTGAGSQTAIVQRGNLIQSASSTGTLIVNSDATFGFQTSGQVKSISVQVGDQVQAGQVLAQLDDTLAQIKYTEAQQDLQELSSAASIAAVQKEIATAQDAEYYDHEWLKYLLSPEVIEAEENLAIAQQNLATAQVQTKANPSAAADQTVKEKQAAVAFLQDKLSQAQTYYENEYRPKNFGEWENVGSRRHPKQALVTYIDPYTGKEVPKIDGPSAADVTTARNNYAQDLQTVKEGQIYLEALRTGVIPEGATGTKLDTLYQAQKAIKDAKAALDAAQLIAPVSGTVTSLSLNVGQQVDTSSIVTISQWNQPYTLDVFLDQVNWNLAQVGNKVNVTFKLLPDQTFPGVVTLVYPELNSSSNDTSLVHILVQLDQSMRQDLPAGTGATVEVVGGEARGVLLIPVSAVHDMGGGKYSVTVLQNGQKVKRDVEIGMQNNSYAEVRSGLEAGESVVTQ